MVTMRSPRSQLALTAVLFILGIAIVAQLRAGAGGSRLEALSAQDLTILVGNLNNANDDLRGEIASLERQLEDLESGTLSGETNIGQIRSDLARVRAWSGLDPVGGRGISITVSGEIAGPEVEDLINELRSAGAEAIALGDVRVVPGTVIGGSGASLSVDDTLLGDPFEIRAIGTPESLIGSLTRVGGIIAQLAGTSEATLDVQAIDRLTLPATTRSLVPSHGRPSL